MQFKSATISLLGMALCLVTAAAQAPQYRIVYLPPPPKGGADIVSAGAARFLETGSAKLEIKEPLRIYNAGTLESLAAGQLGATESAEYFYGIFAAGKPLGWARLRVDASGGLRLGAVTSNAPDSNGTAPVLPLAASVDKALKHLAGSTQLQYAPYEVRLLSIIGTTGGGPFFALWLKPSAGADLIYTLDQRFKPAGINTEQLYLTTEFMQWIQPVAKQRLEQNRQQPASPRGAPPGR